MWKIENRKYRKKSRSWGWGVQGNNREKPGGKLGRWVAKSGRWVAKKGDGWLRREMGG
jgi:hypothetical protein